MSTKRKLPSKLGQPIVKPSAKVPTKQTLDDSRTIVSERSHADVDTPKTNGVKEVVDVASDSPSEEEEDSEEEEEEEEEEGSPEESRDVEAQEATKQDIHMFDISANEAALPPTELSFGDLLLAQPSSPINVAATFSSPTIPQVPAAALSLAPGTSLTTVLAQALKTNDVPLLESILQTSSTPTIRSTIQRLSSPLASTLLSHLAARLHRRPGRAGTLMVWIQWTLVSHGGYLATRADLVKELAALNRVIEERARGLHSLLALKGKLDLLEAQMMLRRGMREQGRGDGDDTDLEGVVYVEGEEDDSEDDEGGLGSQSKRTNGAVDDSASEEGSEDMPTTNGIMAEGASSDEEDESDEDAMVDDEAEETDADTGDEDEVNHSDVDDDDEEEEEEEEEESDAAQPPPKKMVRAGGLFSRRQ